MWFAIELETKTKKQKRQLHRGVEEKDEEKEGKEEHEQEQEEQDEVTMWYLFLAFLQILSMYRFSPAPQTASNSTRLMMNCFSILILRLGGSADMRCTPSYVKRKKNIYINIILRQFHLNRIFGTQHSCMRVSCATVSIQITKKNVIQKRNKQASYLSSVPFLM